MPSLYLVRHAEPAVTGVLLGQSNPSLSDAGRQQASKVQVPSFAACYTSPLLRSVETAAALNVPTTIIPDLREITYGEWDGRVWADIEQRWPDIARRKMLDWTGVTPPGGEAWAAFEQRVSAALDAILKMPLPALLIGHEAVHSVIAARVAGEDPTTFQQSYCELVELPITREADSTPP